VKNVKVDDDAHKLLKAVAALQGRQVSDVASEAILEYCFPKISRETRENLFASLKSPSQKR
jgi:uncharacterized protein (DUF1778 family)